MWHLFHSQTSRLTSMLLVCKWPHFVGQNHIFVKMFFNRDSAIQKCFQKILHSLQGRKFGSQPAVQTMCHTIWMPLCPKHQPSGQRVIPSGRRELPIRTFPCFEKFRTAPACIRLDVSIARPDDSQYSISFRISFQNTVMGRLLQPSGRCGFPSGSAHP